MLFYNPAPRRKSVHFVSKASTAYSNLVVEGFKENLSNDFDFTQHRPEFLQSESADWQVEQITKISKSKVDALALVPANDDPDLIAAVVNLRRRGIPVVLIDYKFRNRHFVEKGLLPPEFVYANPLEAGNMLGSVLADEIKGGVEHVILLLGCGNSAVALYRTQAIALRALQAADSKPIAISLIELVSWRLEEEPATRLDKLLNEYGAQGKRTVVVCANDAVLDEVDRMVPDQFSNYVKLIGCDGSKREDGRLFIDTSKRGIATVDINPQGQGAKAASIINLKLHGKAEPISGYNVQSVKQALLRRTTSGLGQH